MAFENLLPELLWPGPPAEEAASRARRIRKASRSSSVLKRAEEVWVNVGRGVVEVEASWDSRDVWDWVWDGGCDTICRCDCIASSLSKRDGGRRIQTTHHPRDVLHVRSISVKLRRVLETVARICECTLRASARLQDWPLLALLLRPSAMRTPGSGILGRLDCTVRLIGSKTRS